MRGLAVLLERISRGPAAPVARGTAVFLRCALAVTGVLGLSSVTAHAEQLLAPVPVKPGQIRIDGHLGEWRGARFAELGDDADGSLEYALGYDPEALYVGARVFDDAFVRSARPGKKEDAVVLSLALPLGRAWPVSEVWLFAGIIGAQKASAAVAVGGGNPKPSSQIRIVEGPLDEGEGYVLEARVPWSVLRGGDNHHLARGAIRLLDVDERGGRPEGELWSARLSGKPRTWPPVLAAGGPNAALHDFLREKGGAGARRDLIGDVMGDRRLERVAVTGTYVAVVGAEIQGGGGYSYLDLPVAMGAGVRQAELRDLTGDGKAELIVRLRQKNDMGSRDVLQVLMLSGDQPRKVFAVELAKQTAEGSVEAALSIGKGPTPSLTLQTGSARGLSADNYRERPAVGTVSILLPWGPVSRRVYRWDGARFAVVEEEANTQAAVATASLTRSSGSKADDPGRGDGPGTVTHPKPPGMDALVAGFREAQGVPASLRPRFVRHVNVAEDRRVESVMLFGKDLLVIGKGFEGGTGWFYFSLPVRSASDVQRLFTGDVTGDGRREIFVRHKQRIEDVQRELLVGYSFDGNEFRQILSVEVRRARGGDSVGNVVALVPRGRHWALRIDPGLARGWDRDSYPFVAESMDGHLPLLLPWKDGAVSFAYRDGRLVP